MFFAKRLPRLPKLDLIAKVSDEKQTALGAGHFLTQLYTFRDQKGEIVSSMRFRILKFKPRETAAPEPG